jgi:hypothetical protein
MCENYCDTVMTNCGVEGFEQFLSRGHCLGFCEKLDPGTPDDNAGNTAGCRLHYAVAAEGGSELGFNCPIAGPGGDGVCGDNCDGFCIVAVQTCSTQMPVATALDCIRNCGNLPDVGPFHAKIQTGNSLQCRLYHLSAAQTDPLLHCPHVGGVGPCND